MSKPILYRYIALFLISIFLILSLSCGATPTAELTPSKVTVMTPYPILAIRPVSIPLSGEWCFSIDKDQVGEGQGWANAEFDDSSWVAISVPHTWNVMSEYSDYEGLAWYRRTFTAP